MLIYPDISPVAISVGPLEVHWYGLMYLVGFMGGWWLGRLRTRRPGTGWRAVEIGDLVFYAALGVVLGGRIGYTLVYNFSGFLADPLVLLRIWQGGMSFHGGLVGVLFAMWLYARRTGRTFFQVTDYIAPLIPVGLGAGRIGNFINGELWGKATDVPWAVVVNGVALHPSQLYEAALEGLALFVIMWWFTSRPRYRWAPSGLFLVCYGVFRIAVEFVRVPDENRGYLLLDWVTMGQLLSLPMIVFGLAMLAIAYARREPSGNQVAG